MGSMKAMKRKIFLEDGHCHFVTFSCFERRKLLTEPEAKQIILNALSRLVSDKGVYVVGFVVMNDHVHAILGYTNAHLHPITMQEWKRWSSYFLRKYFATQEYPYLKQLSKIWQRKYYDFNLYSLNKVQEKLDYMHQNPVKSGLVKHAEEDPWSSFCYYQYGKSVGVHVTPLW